MKCQEGTRKLQKPFLKKMVKNKRKNKKKTDISKMRIM